MKTTNSFNAEIQQLLNLVVNSLYSHKEIFLRELISNASDALDKKRFLSLTNKDIQSDEDLSITLELNSDQKTLKISDNGIGMSLEDVHQYLGTIAQSGTKKFQELFKNQNLSKDELIGQFGVGFYSAFMVADKVQVHTQKAGLDSQTQKPYIGVIWESQGDGKYTTEELSRISGAGTTITLFLKDEISVSADDESGQVKNQNFSDEWTVKSLVKKYSDFISYPIRLKKPKKDQPTEFEFEVLNSQKALWQKPASEISADEYTEFYKHLTHDWMAPAKTIHFKAEGVLEFVSLLFIPEKKPWNYHFADADYGLNLYAKKVFIKSETKELLPPYLRFVKGLVDSSDLSLNVSREMLQQDRQLAAIKKSLISKVFSQLKDWMKADKPNYEKFFIEFGATLKEGLATDATQKDKIQDLILFKSSWTQKNSSENPTASWTTLEDYVQRMKTDQKNIYFMSASSVDHILHSPYMEKLAAKDYEVLFLTDAVDEWVVNVLTSYKDKKLQSITAEDLDLTSAEDKEKNEQELKSLTERFKGLVEFLKVELSSSVKDVRLTTDLKDTAAILVNAKDDPSARMESLLKQMGKADMVSEAKRILELNPKHPVVEKMLALQPEQQRNWAEILFNQALLNEGSALPNPHKFTKQITDLMKNLN